MKRITKITLVAVTVFVCFVCLVNAIWLIFQSGSVAGWWGENMQAQWTSDSIGLQRFIFWGRLLAGLVFDVMLAVFMFKSVMAIKSGLLFPMSNVLVLVAAAVCNLLYNFCNTNIGKVVYPERLLEIADSDILLPLILFAFALMYGLAAKVSEDSRLTI